MNFGFRQAICCSVITLLVLIQNEIVAVRVFGCNFHSLTNFKLVNVNATPDNPLYGDTDSGIFYLRNRNELMQLEETLSAVTKSIIEEYTSNNVDVYLSFHRLYYNHIRQHGPLDDTGFENLLASYITIFITGSVSYAQAIAVLDEVSKTWMGGTTNSSGFVAALWPNIDAESLVRMYQPLVNPYCFFPQQAVVVLKFYLIDSFFGYMITDPAHGVTKPAIIWVNGTSPQDVSIYEQDVNNSRNVAYQSFDSALNFLYVTMSDFDRSEQHLIKLKPICSFMNTMSKLELFNTTRGYVRRDANGNRLASIMFTMAPDVPFNVELFYMDENGLKFEYEVGLLHIDDLKQDYYFSEIARELQMHEDVLYEEYTSMEIVSRDRYFLYHLQTAQLSYHERRKNRPNLEPPKEHHKKGRKSRKEMLKSRKRGH